jgi:N-acetyl-gamma-glutamyl-phosphate reductase
MELAEFKNRTASSASTKRKLFIDGEHGTTGLQIRERIAGRQDIVVLSAPAEERRNTELRAELLNEADIAILCLPDDASREAVALLARDGNRRTRLIDASTAHRTDENWVFGFAEMTQGQRDAIAEARFVANPGCYSTGAIALLRPLSEAGLLPERYPVTINAVSGYTGGGKNLIAQMEDSSREDHIPANHYLYALGLAHKHLPEITTHAMLSRAPLFAPSVGRFAQGMLVNVPLHTDLLVGSPTADDIHAVIERHYRNSRHVTVVKQEESGSMGRVDAQELVGTDRMKLYVFGSADGRLANCVATLDNLGKGASGAAVQNLDIMLGR